MSEAMIGPAAGGSSIREAARAVAHQQPARNSLGDGDDRAPRPWVRPPLQARVRATERRPTTMFTEIGPVEIEARKGSGLCVRAGDRAQAEALVGGEQSGRALNRSRAGRPREVPTIRRHRHNSPQPL